ncbi:tax1-binding protein 1 homolog A-like [Oncorhynchus keta]|uniref:tax1-binding protein 1 homolog A-like n=1 Tax=Oncorhynchus keta TaxID=8018 RepID=UPI00227D294F|nr:tax1-binding protein 1 homolog A-like [Oncorhynchus keta]
MRIQSVFLQYPLPYPQDAPTPLLVPRAPHSCTLGTPPPPQTQETERTGSSLMTCCPAFLLWAPPPGIVTWSASSQHATSAGPTAWRTQRSSRTTTT